MLTEKEAVKKLCDYAVLFTGYARAGEWGKAHNIYNAAHEVAVFMEMGDHIMKMLFGDWDSDDGTGAAKDNGMFQRWRVEKVNWRCCIERHQSYEDVACRRLGVPERYYSDEDYCALCRKRKMAVR